MITLLTLPEVAQELQISLEAVRRLICTEQLVVHRLGLQTMRVSRADLDCYLLHRDAAQETPPKKTLPWHTRGADRFDPRPVFIAGYAFWQVELGHQGGRRRVRRTFANREEAQAFAELAKIERKRPETCA
jgi:excisionase family DNA binding protein